MFVEKVEAFALDLLDEAGRLEAAANAISGAPPEITASMMHDANRALRQRFGKGRLPRWLLWCRIGVVASSVLSGLFVAYVDKGWGLILFLVSFVSLVVLSAVVLFQEAK